MNCRSIIMIGCIGILSLTVIGGGLCYLVIDRFGWYGISGILACILIFSFSFRVLIGKIFMIPFILKSNALKGAEIKFAKIERVGDAPKDEFDTEGLHKKCDYDIEFSIVPKKSNKLYDVGEILIVDCNSELSMKVGSIENVIGSFLELSIKQDNEWINDFDKVAGIQYFKGKLRCEPKEKVKFQYYFNYIGTVDLPVM